jgi:hypothetical protein
MRDLYERFTDEEIIWDCQPPTALLSLMSGHPRYIRTALARSQRFCDTVPWRVRQRGAWRHALVSSGVMATVGSIRFFNTSDG